MKNRYKPVAQSRNFKISHYLIPLLKIVLICVFLILLLGCSTEKTVPIKIEKPVINCRQTVIYVRDAFNCVIMLDEAQ